MRTPALVGVLRAGLLAAVLMSQAGAPTAHACAVGWKELLAVPASPSGQWYRQQAGIFPVFDGWETSPDGSRLFYFGYMNRHPPEVTVPVGSENGFEPGPVDRGQPTNFLPGRQRHVYTVKVPADFKDKLVWTVTSEVGAQRRVGTRA